MSEISFPPNTTNNSKKTNLPSLLLSDLLYLFYSFNISHPLYFTCFIFFSPYIIKIFSFLSPLFITTSLLLIALFTTFVHGTCYTELSEKSHENFLLISNADDASGQLLNLEDMEAYKMVFDGSEEGPVCKHLCHESFADEIMKKADRRDDQRLAAFLKEDREKGEKEVKLNKINEAAPAMSKMRVNSQRLGADHHLWSNDNSPMRKEKEWRRTLACKLFEERHSNVDQGCDEGMDMLWETYDEADSNKQKLLGKTKTNKGKKCSKYVMHEEDDDDDDGQLCCLQALKFSAGKMNLGMGRPNLVKISRAFKGIGWLHNVTKHGKKIYR